MNNAYQNNVQNIEPLDDRLDIFFREIELAIRWQRPSILLAIYPSEDVHAEAEASLENKLITCGQQVVHIQGEGGSNLDVGLFISKVPDPDKNIFFVDGLHRAAVQDGFDLYQSLNQSREYFVEKQIRIVFWLTEAEAVNLAHFAPDFWASRHRVIDFIESQKPDETFIRALESAWQGQGEHTHMAENLINTHAKISLRETTQAGLPEWDGSTTAGVNLLLTLGIMHWRKGDHDKADESLRSALDIAIKTQDKRLEAVCFNAIALVKTDLGQLDEAVEAYEQAIELAPEKTFIWGHLGNLYSQLGQFEEAIEAFLNTLEHNPVDLNVWNSLGNAYANTGRTEEAIDAYRKAVELNERFVDPWMSLGGLFKKQGLSAEAIKAYQKVVGINSNNAQAWNELGNIHFETQTFDEAIEAYSIAIKLGLESGWSYCNLAFAYAHKGEFASAIPFYHKSIELLESDADKAIAWNRLGDACRQVKDYDNAIAAYQAADRLAEGGPASAGQLSYLNGLIAGEEIVNEISTEILDQVRELTASEEAAPAPEDPAQPQDETPAEENALAESPEAAAETPAPEAAQPEAEAQPAEAAAPVTETVEAADVEAAESDPQVVAEEPQETPAVESALAEASLPDADVAVAEPSAPEAAQAEPDAPESALDDEDESTTHEVITSEALDAEPEDAVPAEQSAPETDLRNAHIWNELGNIYFKVAAYDEALDAYNKAIELGLELGLLYSNLGYACVYKGKLAEAVPLYLKSIELLEDGKDKAVTWSRLGDVYRQANDLADAISAYGKAIELDPSNDSFKDNLNEIREQLDRLENAPLEAAVTVQTDDAPAPVEASPAEDTEDAPAQEEDENDEGVAVDLISQIFEELAVPEPVSETGEPGEAQEAPVPVAEATEDAVSAQADSETIEAVEEAVLEAPAAEAADEAAVQEQAPVAEVEPQAAAEAPAPASSPASVREIDLKNAHIWNELGNIFAKANAFDDAIDAYNKAIQLEPDFGWPYSNLGLAFVQKGEFGEAIPLYQKSIELFAGKKDKAVSWNRLGDAYRLLNEYDNAIAAYQIADELNQDEGQDDALSANELRELNINQAAPLFSYIDGGSHDRF